MKLGVIFCAWEAEDQLPSSLTPWIEARATRPAGHEFVICAVSVPFKGFEQPASPDHTVEMLSGCQRGGDINHLITSAEPLTEVDARGRALRWLVEQGCDVTWQVDSDETYTTAQIAAITRFIESKPLTTWFRLCLRNAVFQPGTYLVEPFTPPRIHRVLAGPYRAAAFYDDNNVAYNGTVTRDRKLDTHFASMTVPKTVAWIPHQTWLSNERSRRKCEYQLSRNWDPSFRWDYESNSLRWNEQHFARTGQPIPEVEHDSA